MIDNELHLYNSEDTTNVLFTAFYEIERRYYARLGNELSFEEYKQTSGAENNLCDAENLTRILLEYGYRIVKPENEAQTLESASVVDFNSSAASKDGSFLERFG